MKTAVAFAAAILLGACGSGHGAGMAKVPEPRVRIEQTSNVPEIAEHVSGGLSISLQMAVTNQATIPIKLGRAELVSVGEGGWNLRQTQRRFDRLLQPGETGTFDIWVEAESGSSIAGNNAPVVLRVTTVYDSSAGPFQHVTMQHVGGRVQ